MKKILIYILPALLMFGCKKKGCTDKIAFNYDNDPKVESDPSLCEYTDGYNGLTKKIVYGEIAAGANVVWSKVPGATVDYLVSANVRILGDLTIDPGVVVQFTNTGGLKLGQDGKLVVNGTLSSRIVLENAEGTVDWLGIFVESGYPSNGRELKLHNVTIRNASHANNSSAVFIDNYCSLDFKNLTLDGGTDYGLYISDMGFTSTMNNVTIKGFLTPFKSYEGKIIGDLDQFTLIDNGKNWFEFSINYISTSALNSFNNKYPVYFSNTGNITFNDLYVQSGSEFIVPDYASLTVNGVVSCQGTLNSPIVFRGDGNSPGWKGLKIKMLNNIQFNYTKIQGVYGGSGIQVDYYAGGFLSCTNSQIEGIQGVNVSCGISFSGVANVPSNKYDITGTTFTNTGFDICP